jgi:8-hydroxy-5-deazaflavin:NADPH oxidoreductase
MTTLSIIGTGGLARALATRAAGAGHAVQVVGRDRDRAAALAAAVGGGATAGVLGADALDGRLVVLAVPYAAAAAVVADLGPALAGRVVVDATNPFDPAGSGLLVPRDSSAAEQIAAAAAPGVAVVKAFNTLFGNVLADPATGRLDVFVAGDDADAKAVLGTFVESLGLRPVDTGALATAHWLEGVGLLVLGQAVQRGDFSLNVRIVG